MHTLFTLSLIILISVSAVSAASSEFCSTVYADYHRRQLAYFSEDGVFDIESGAKHVVSFLCYVFCDMCSFCWYDIQFLFAKQYVRARPSTNHVPPHSCVYLIHLLWSI